VGSIGVIFEGPKGERQNRPEAADEIPNDAPRAQRQPDVAAANPSSSPILAIAGVAVGLAVTAAIALAFSVLTGGPRLDNRARITTPQSGSTIGEPTAVRVQVNEPEDIARVVFHLDGAAFATSQAPPFSATLDPQQLAEEFPDIGDGTHVLTIAVESEEGERAVQPDTITLAFDLGEAPPTADASEPPPTAPDPQPEPAPGGVDVRQLAGNLAVQISQKSGYAFDREFAEQIRLRTSEYRGYNADDARRYRREIAAAFSSQGLNPLLGFVTAMSRTKFRATAPAVSNASGESGIWRLPPRVAQNYFAAGESDTALGNSQRSAQIAAAYTKDLVTLFGTDDFMFAIASYGLPLSEAGKIKVRLEEVAPDPTARGDFWKLVESGVVPREGADRVVSFFAAGIVGENPQVFGLQTERLSSLY
jgi:hypothetical protein